MAGKNSPKQQGSVGIVAVIAMMVLVLAGTAYVGLALTELKISTTYRDGAAAQYLAEAGALSARMKLKYDTENFRSLTNTDAGYPNPPIRVYKNSDEPTAGYYEVIVKRFQSDPAMREIVSVGTVHSAQRIVKIRLEISPGMPVAIPTELQETFTYGLVSGSKLTIGDNGLVSGTIRTNDRLHIGKATINGTCYYSVDNRGVFVDQQAMLSTSPVIVTSYLPFPDLTLIRSDCQTKATRTVAGDYIIGTNQSFNKDVYFVNGNLSFTNNITMTGKAIFYVTGDITVSASNGKGNMLLISDRNIIIGPNNKLENFLMHAAQNIYIDSGSSVVGALSAQGEIILQEGASVSFENSFLGRAFDWTNF